MTPNPTTPPATADPGICPICEREKVAFQWVCHSCFRRLPQNFRKSFSALKLQALWWLRQHPAAAGLTSPVTFPLKTEPKEKMAPARHQSKIGRLRAALLELLAEHERDDALPTSARFLFYELVQRGILSKERKDARPAS